jgi:hypothetical protein
MKQGPYYTPVAVFTVHPPSRRATLAVHAMFLSECRALATEALAVRELAAAADRHRRRRLTGNPL